MQRCHFAAIENIFVINYLLLFFLYQVLCTHVEDFKCSCPKVWKGVHMLSVFQSFEPPCKMLFNFFIFIVFNVFIIIVFVMFCHAFSGERRIV